MLIIAKFAFENTQQNSNASALPKDSLNCFLKMMITKHNLNFFGIHFRAQDIQKICLACLICPIRSRVLANSKNPETTPSVSDNSLANDTSSKGVRIISQVATMAVAGKYLASDLPFCRKDDLKTGFLSNNVKIQLAHVYLLHAAHACGFFRINS